MKANGKIPKTEHPWQNKIVGHADVPPDQLLASVHNFRIHPEAQQHALAGSIDTVGYIRSVTVSKRTDTVIDGHLRVVLAMRNNEPTIPVEYVDLTEDEERQALLMLDPIAAMSATDKEKLDELLRQVQSDDERVTAMLAEMAEREGLRYGEIEKPQGKPNPRNLPLDVIYTLQGADSTCCLAVRSGLKYGIQSPNSRICPYCEYGDESHRVIFIDNDYFDYNHQAHLRMIKSFRPKYATVRDVMSKEQCAKDGIAYYHFEQVMEWAEEIAQFTENAVVIPKYDCLSDIPEKFVIGYSVPTSHGGTPLPIEMFKGRRVHLLGGSWKDQLSHLAALGDDVISLDNNYVQLIAKQYAQFITPEGETKNLTKEGFPYLTNPRYVALALSFGAIGFKLNELYGGRSNPPEKETKHEYAKSS